ncbi:MAG: cache domain-containing protein [bacterium]
MGKISIKKKILLVSVSICFFSALILGITTFNYFSNVLVNQKIDEISKITNGQVHQTSEELKNNVLFTKVISRDERVIRFLKNKDKKLGSNLLDYFNIYAKEDSKYLAIYLLDKNGITLVSTDATFVGQDYSFRDYFKKAIKKEPYVDVYMGKTSQKFGYYFSYPVLDDKNEMIGAMITKIDSTEINESIDRNELSKANNLMLAEQNGVVIYSNEPNRFLKSLGVLSSLEVANITETDKFLGKEIVPIQYEVAQNIIRNYKTPETKKFFDLIDDEDEIISVTKVGDFPFFLITEIGLESVSSLVFLTTIIFTSIVLLGLILMSLLFYRLFILIIRPLEDLRILVGRISSGDFSQKAKIDSGDEFGSLAVAFNKMSLQLGDLYRNLDNKVQERTSELEKSKSELNEALNESERLNKTMVGRELEMIELKKQIDALKNNQ